MNQSKYLSHLTRRNFLQVTGLTGGVILGGGIHGLLSSCSQSSSLNANQSNPTIRTASTSFTPDLEIDLQAIPKAVQIQPGQPTQVWSYEAKLVKGDPASLQLLPDSYLGSVIRVRRGQRVRVNFRNNLPAGQPSIVHWHGLMLPEEMDGHPRFAIQPGQQYIYEFEVINRAGTYWFHPHPDRLTGEQTYAGLAGLLLVTDDEEIALNLPAGDYDLPIVLQDRTFDSSNQLIYLDNGIGKAQNNGMGNRGGMMGNRGGMMGNLDQMMGFLGQMILVNGKPNYVLSAATRIYRLRILNGSNSRIYKLAWSNGDPMIAIATDGRLLARPVERKYLMLAPGERVDVWADFSKLKVGTELTLNSLAFSGAENIGGMGNMGQMGGRNTALAVGTAMPLFDIKIDREERETRRLPNQLASLPLLRPQDAVNANNPRPVTLSLNGMQWQINDRSFEMEAATPEETVKLNTIEQWEVINQLNRGAMMDASGMAHPIHLHGTQFQVISREVLPELQAGWNTVKDGYIDQGLKDTVMVMPGERIKLLMKFEHYTGLFVYHCHNLEHEDRGMMRNYRVTA
ncbi:multicopper oxidase family protein [Phormidesmis priestleyi]|uniref:multicopper oxidase family protein n=1 Tax=Phormidesmis priestleyi TaxID=268141 RepID=UPI00083B8D0E|nr:multicopper oxidase domain-containing protein [Phormidesmis priestleyi]